jgi:hypothetical protein
MSKNLILDFLNWLNANEGTVAASIFLITLFLGWVSGIFASLRRKPTLRLKLIAGPTFCSTFLTGEKNADYDVHRTAVALYLSVSNIGSAPTSIENVAIGYRWHVKAFSVAWLRYRLRWFWLHHQTAALNDFQVKIGDSVKHYPSLFQRSTISPIASETYLEPGRSVNGVVYFEQTESWGGCFPSPRRGRTRIIVSITDVFGKKYKSRFWIPIVTLNEAKQYNPSFGDTIPALRRGPNMDSAVN